MFFARLQRNFPISQIVTILAFCMMTMSARADLVKPDPSIAPVEVVAIQLKALQFNDNPKPDFGIAQTWAFAHPRNRAATGPLPRFASMIKGPSYAKMLNHSRHEISRSWSGRIWRNLMCCWKLMAAKFCCFSGVLKRLNPVNLPVVG